MPYLNLLLLSFDQSNEYSVGYEVNNPQLQISNCSIKMREYTVSVKTVDGATQKTTEVPSDMSIADFREAATEILGLSQFTTILVNEKTQEVVKDILTFEELGVEDGQVFILVPEAVGGGGQYPPKAAGGGGQYPPKKINALFLRVTYQNQTSNVSVAEDTTIYLLIAASLNNFIRKDIPEIKETNNYKALLKRTNSFLKKTNTLAQENLLNNDELIIVHDLEDPIDRLKFGYQVPQNTLDKLDISAPVSIPKREDMAVLLVPADIVYRLEEYRSDQHHWESIMWTLVGAILGVLVNWSTSEPLVISKVSVIIITLLFIFSSITFSSAIKYKKRANKMKERMMNSLKPANPD